MRRTYRLPHLRKNNYPATLSPIGPPSWGHAERRRFLSSSRKESWGNAERNVSRCVSGLASPMELPGFRSIFRKPSRGTEGERAEKTHLLRTGPPLHFPHPRKSAPTPYKPRRTILKQPLPPASFSPLRKNNTPEIKNPAPPHGGPGQQNSNSSDYRLADFTIMASLPMRPRR